GSPAGADQWVPAAARSLQYLSRPLRRSPGFRGRYAPPHSLGKRGPFSRRPGARRSGQLAVARLSVFIYGKTAANAISVMSYLAADPSRRAGSGEIAAARGISQALTAKLLTQLASAGLVSGQPGPGGGYTLAKPARKISLM